MLRICRWSLLREARFGVKKWNSYRLEPGTRRFGTLSEPKISVSVHMCADTLLLRSHSQENPALFSFLTKTAPRGGVLVHLCTLVFRAAESWFPGVPKRIWYTSCIPETLHKKTLRVLVHKTLKSVYCCLKSQLGGFRLEHTKW